MPHKEQAKFESINVEFGTGAQRGTNTGRGRFDLLSPIVEERTARHSEVGGNHYGDRNWEKGIPLSRYVDSLRRHLCKWMQGSKEEDHLAAICWNAQGLLHTHEMIQRGRLPEYLDDLPRNYLPVPTIQGSVTGYEEPLFEEPQPGQDPAPQIVPKDKVQPLPILSPETFVEQYNREHIGRSVLFPKQMTIDEYLDMYMASAGAKMGQHILLDRLMAWAPCVYVSGPYTEKNLEGKVANTIIAAWIGQHLMQLGYNVVVPHTMTHWMDTSDMVAEQFLKTDLRLLRGCDILFRQSESPGSDIELEAAARYREEDDNPIRLSCNLRDFTPLRTPVTTRPPEKWGHVMSTDYCQDQILQLAERTLKDEFGNAIYNKVTGLVHRLTGTGVLAQRLFVPDLIAQRHRELWFRGGSGADRPQSGIVNSKGPDGDRNDGVGGDPVVNYRPADPDADSGVSTEQSS